MKKYVIIGSWIHRYSKEERVCWYNGGSLGQISRNSFWATELCSKLHARIWAKRWKKINKGIKDTKVEEKR